MKLFQVDAFTKEAFKGNPAGVCILENEISEDMMQKIAAEMNLSETAFLLKQAESRFKLRWFTPRVEVDLCGHATLASAHILFSCGMADKTEKIKFDTKSGYLYASSEDEKVVMDFPQLFVEECELPAELKEILGIQPLAVFKNKKRYLIEIDKLEELLAVQPDFNALAAYERAFMITCRSDNSGYDFYSRFFAPCVGINEDPVTGSAHSYLAPYWSRRLSGKKALTGCQVSERGGVVGCEIISNDRLLLKGDAVTVFEIEYIIS